MAAFWTAEELDFSKDKDDFFSWFSFRQAAPVQGACGGRAPRSPPGSLAGVEEEGGKTFEKR